MDSTAAVTNPAESGPLRVPRPTLLYGGTLFDHFGHLVLDLTRTYQLLRLFRRSKEPIWFHYPMQARTNPAPDGSGDEAGSRAGRRGSISNPLVLEWLECLGIRKRARVIIKKLPASMLVSSNVLYRDRQFVTSDFPQAAQAALAPQLRRRLLKLERQPGRIAYLSRHRLQSGTTRFVGEQEVVRAISNHPRIDVICPEELSIADKLGLFRRYELIAGFPQACMNLKCFAPYGRVDELARQVMFIAGPQSLSSNWVNLDRACGFGDRVLETPADTSSAHDDPAAADAMGFQRSNGFDAGLVLDALHELAR